MKKLIPFFLVWFFSLALANEYEWRDVVQTVDIEANGDVIVTDERTLWTDEDFGEAYICIRLDAGETLTLLEDSGSLSGHDANAFQQNCESGAQGQELVVKHPYRINEGRVRFHYKLENTVDFYSDVVQWYWIILEQDHPNINGYQLTVNIPGSMTEPFNAYVHRFGNLEKPQVNLSENRQQLNVHFNRVPSDDGVEIVYLMDPTLFSKKGTEPGFENALKNELELAGLQEKTRESSVFRSDPKWGLGGLGVFLALLTGIIGGFRKHGREPEIQTMKYPFEPPSDIPPAAVTAMGKQMFSRSDMGQAFYATIMDLARRGYAEFTSQGKKFEMQLDLEKSPEGLLPFEADILSYLKKAAASSGDPTRLDFKELKRYSEKHASHFMLSWAKKPRTWIEQHFGGPLTTPESQKATNRWSGFCFFAALLCGAGGVFTSGIARGSLIAAAAMCLLMIFVIMWILPAWRKEVAQEVYGWEGFKRTLTDYTQMKDAPDDFFKLWDRYFCYAAALGVAEKFLKNIQKAAPLRGMEETVRQRGVWMGSMSSGSNFSSFSQSISSMASALNSASASASSGGSSSGGGGGGGGGSSGGR